MSEISAGAIVYTKQNDQIRYLLIQDFHDNYGFPKGHLEKDETLAQAAVREIREEFDADIRVKEFLCTVEHEYDSFYLVMDCFICELLDEKLVLHDHSDLRMIDPYEEDVEWLPADRKVLQAYRSMLECRKGGICDESKEDNS